MINKQTSIILLVIAYIVVGTLFALFTPDWQAPDEPAHYNYVAQLAGGQFPVIEPSDYDEAYRQEIVSSRFDEAFSIAPLTYEDWQPPLYYLILTPFYLVSGGSLLVLRLVSVLIGAGVVVMAYKVAGLVFPGREHLTLTTTLFIAFLPQHIAILASINNDSLAEFWIAAILWLLLATPHTPHPTPHTPHYLKLGLVLGLGLLTKATVYIMLPVIGLALLRRYWGRWQEFVQVGLRVGVPAGLLGAVWWVRNLTIYGWPDVMGTIAHDTVVVGQVRTAEWLADFGLAELLRRFAQTTFQSFWGQFGWMSAPLQPRIYQLLLLFTLTVLTGFIWSALRGQKTEDAGRKTLHPLPTPYPLPSTLYPLLTTFLFSTLLYLGYNLTFVQHQGRYLFPGLIPIGLGVAVGMWAWLRPGLARWDWLRWLVPAGFALALITLNLYALFRTIVPYL